MNAAVITPRTMARKITDWLEPRTWIIAVTVLVAVRADGVAGLGWSLVALAVAVGLPSVFFERGLRRGRWSDRHVGVRSQRLPLMAFLIVCASASLALLAVAGAPRPVVAVIAAMLATGAVLTAITAAWKVSVHSATSSGAVVILAITFGLPVLACYCVVAAVGWSRLALRDHTLAQVLVGALLGAGIGAVAYLGIR